MWQLCTPCAASTGDHQHPAACPQPRCSPETTSASSLCACLWKKIPTFMHVQQCTSPNFAWSWISVTVWIFLFYYLGPVDSLYTSVLSSTQCQSIIFFYHLESLSYYYGDYTACVGYVQLNGRMCWQEISFDTGDTTCEIEQFFCKYVFNINYFTFWHECLQICDAKRSLNLSPFLLLWIYLSQISWDFLHCSVVVWTSSFTCLSKRSWRITCLITSQDQETENV